MHDGDWVLIAAASHDWTELLNLIAILVLGLISGAVTLIKRYLDNKQQQKEKESKSGEGGIVPGVLVDDEAPARRAGARPAQGTAPPQRPLPQSPVPVATSVPGAPAAPAVPRAWTPVGPPHVPVPVPEASVRRAARNKELAERAIGKDVAFRAVQRTAMQVLGRESPAGAAGSKGGKAVQAAAEALPGTRQWTASSVAHDPETTSPAALRRMVVMSEVLGLPIALRDSPPGDQWSW